MRRWPLVLCFIVIGSGFALQAVQLSRSHYDLWLACQRDDDCTMLQGPCGVAWAVNRKYVWDSKLHPPREVKACTVPAENHPPGTAARCEAGKCRLVP